MNNVKIMKNDNNERNDNDNINNEEIMKMIIKK